MARIHLLTPVHRPAWSWPWRFALGTGLIANVFFFAVSLVALSARTVRQPVTKLDSVLSRGRLRVGCPLDYAPFALRCSTGNTVRAMGSDIDAVVKLADSLGVTVDIVPTTWAQIVQDAPSFDMAVGGISPTLARRRYVGFSREYLSGGKVIVARCGSPLLNLSPSALNVPSVRAVVNLGGTNERFVRQALPHAHLAIVSSNGDQFAVVANLTADMTVTDRVEAELQAFRQPELCAGRELLTEDTKAFMLPRDDYAWANYVNSFVSEWLESGNANSSMSRWLMAWGSNQSFCEAGVVIDR